MTRHGIEAVCIRSGKWATLDGRFEMVRSFPVVTDSAGGIVLRDSEPVWRIDEYDPAANNGKRVFVVGVVDRLRDALESIADYTRIRQYPVPCGPEAADPGQEDR